MDSLYEHDEDTDNKHDPVKASLGIQLKTSALDRKIKDVEREQETLMNALDVGGYHRGLRTPGNLSSALKDLRQKESQLREEKLLLMRMGFDNGYSYQCANRDDEDETSLGSTRSDSSSQADTTHNCTNIKPTHKLFVKTVAGDTKTFKVSPNATVIDLKEQIKDRLGYPPEGLNLKYRGKMLQEGLTLVRCGVTPEATIRVVMSATGDKPVILLYPPTQLKVSVRLTLSSHWTFSALYPKPRGMMVQQSWNSQGGGDRSCEWKVRASPDGTLRDFETKKEYPYLFWEAYSAEGQVVRSFYLNGTRSFCVAGGKTGIFLNKALTRLGLNARERCDMITYWLLHLEAYPFSVIYFVDAQRYAQEAELTIVPTPDVVIRVFMAFRGVETYDATLDTAELGDLTAPARDGFVAVEWGGMNLNGLI